MFMGMLLLARRRRCARFSWLTHRVPDSAMRSRASSANSSGSRTRSWVSCLAGARPCVAVSAAVAAARAMADVAAAAAVIERLDLFMARANAAYYAARDPFADFTTGGPSISQVLVNCSGCGRRSCGSRWESPVQSSLAEAGPGRGTLMGDALRAIGQTVPEFSRALRLHLGGDLAAAAGVAERSGCRRRSLARGYFGVAGGAAAVACERAFSTRCRSASSSAAAPGWTERLYVQVWRLFRSFGRRAAARCR